MPATAPRVRLSGPAELVAALPTLCGFVPSESLVVVCLAGSRVDLVARYDLPPPEAVPVLLGDVERRSAHAQTAWLLLLAEQPCAELVEALRARGPWAEVLLVQGGRWRSLLCDDTTCCPVDGTPVPQDSPALTLVRAEATLRGTAVLPDRAALVASLAAPTDGHAALARAGRRLARETVEHGRPAVRERLLVALDTALGRPEEADAAELALGLHDVLLRDELLTWAVEDADAVHALLLHLARCAPAPDDAPVCAALAWVAHARGDGATASVALDRALSSDPEHSLALLLREALDHQVRPEQLQAVAAQTAGLLGAGRRRGRP